MRSPPAHSRCVHSTAWGTRAPVAAQQPEQLERARLPNGPRPAGAAAALLATLGARPGVLRPRIMRILRLHLAAGCGARCPPAVLLGSMAGLRPRCCIARAQEPALINGLGRGRPLWACGARRICCASLRPQPACVYAPHSKRACLPSWQQSGVASTAGVQARRRRQLLLLSALLTPQSRPWLPAPPAPACAAPCSRWSSSPTPLRRTARSRQTPRQPCPPTQPARRPPFSPVAQRPCSKVKPLEQGPSYVH